MRQKSKPSKLMQSPKDLLNAYENGSMSKFQVLHIIIPDKGYYKYRDENNKEQLLKTVKDYKMLGFDDVEDDYIDENEDVEISQVLDVWDIEDDGECSEDDDEEEDFNDADDADS